MTIGLVATPATSTDSASDTQIIEDSNGDSSPP